ncbi:MAG: cupin domain-containing protein, partial [Bacteroidetes bacterium]|nr:cupin domain-containing protein [Bacteroidota bacterium]
METNTEGLGDIKMEEFEELKGLSILRGGGTERGWNGIKYKQGLSGKNVGSKKLSINVATVPPGAVAYAHVHDGFEVMLFIVQGKVKHTYGENLSESVINEAGDFIYIKPGVPHEVFNIGDEDQEDKVLVIMSNTDLDLYEEFEFIGDLDVGEDKTRSFSFTIPNNVEDGIYVLDFTTSYEYDQD